MQPWAAPTTGEKARKVHELAEMLALDRPEIVFILKRIRGSPPERVDQKLLLSRSSHYIPIQRRDQ